MLHRKFPNIAHLHLIRPKPDRLLAGANLKGANLAGADLTAASIHQVKGLSQEQLDMACQYPDGRQPRVPDNLEWNEEKAKERWREYHS